MHKNIKISLALIILFMVSVLSLFINKLTTPRYLSAPELLVNGYYQFPDPKEFSDFKIVTSDSTIIKKSVFDGKWTLIYFGY
ncbi:MAG: SCO family protein, partial [Gammaproteobacteria bacterium]|nr:SCO family protein [Gammaproteobacteria bacterium]